MNDWKELKIDNLPPDILTGDYELGFKRLNDIELCANQDPLNILQNSYPGGLYGTYYRTSEPKAPTHEERAEEYSINTYPYPKNMVSGIGIDMIIDGFRDIAKKAFLAGRESTVLKHNE